MTPHLTTYDPKGDTLTLHSFDEVNRALTILREARTLARDLKQGDVILLYRESDLEETGHGYTQHTVLSAEPTVQSWSSASREWRIVTNRTVYLCSERNTGALRIAPPEGGPLPTPTAWFAGDNGRAIRHRPH